MKNTRRLITIALLLALFCQFLPLQGSYSGLFPGIPAAKAEEANGEEIYEEETNGEESDEEEAVRLVGTADVALKIRRGPGNEQNGVGSIPKGDLVYIMDFGVEWSKIQSGKTVGFVLSKYLKDVRDYNPETGEIGSEVRAPVEVVNYAIGSTDDFHMGYKAYAVRGTGLYLEKDLKSRYLTKVPLYKQVIVSHVEGEWCYAMYEKRKGWIRCDDLFKWDRIDPYAGDIPGCTVYPLMAFTNQATDILDYQASVAGKKDNSLKTINPGTALCVEPPDAEGRYKTPYWRTTGFITEDAVADTMPVVPWEEAQAGDLISVMTTYYAVGVSTLQYQGRNWNIYLATSLISGLILQPNEEFNVNKVIGPYRRATGYKPAPIMSAKATWGYGGGTCQVNTTLYNTIIRIPIYVSHRRVHADVGMKYIPKGFDAAVGGGDINMIFTNTLPYPIRFAFFVSDGVMTCCIFRAV